MTYLQHRRRQRVGLAALLMAGTAMSSTIAFAQSAPTGQSSASPIEEVVVTAEKRAVNIQQVPASVSAVSGDQLQTLGLKDLQDYAEYVPGLEIHQEGSPGQGSVTLRGISAGLGGQGSLIGYYIDDTPLGSSGNYADADVFSLDLLPYDLQQVEVLRGPQGTLYGAGSMGGLIKYVLKQADPDAFSAQAGVELNSIQDSHAPGYALRAAVNMPITDTLAIRVSGFDQVDQGYTDNVRLGINGVNGDQQDGGRVAITWLPTPDITVNLNAIWYRQNSDDNNNVFLGDPVAHTDSRGTVFYTGSPTLGDYAQNDFFREPFSKALDYYSGTVNWNLGWAVATSATSWSTTNTSQPSDQTYSFGNATTGPVAYLGYNFTLGKFTQEVRLTSPSGGMFEWLAGAYYTHENSTFDQSLFEFPITGPFPTTGTPAEYVQLPLSYQEYAAFGDLTVNFSPQFDVTGGLRVSHNDQNSNEGVAIGGVPVISAPGTSGQTNVTWQANARYHFSNDTMAYVRVATGYRPGSPNAALPGGPVPPPAQSDTLISYEAGVKSTFLDGKALIDFAAFDIQWNNIQTNVTVAGQSYLGNAGDAFSRGFELQGSYSPIEGLRIGYDGAYTIAQITSINSTGTPFLTGYQLAGVPKFSGSLNAEYTWPLFGTWRGDLSGVWHYTGSELDEAPTATSFNADDPAYSRVDLQAGLLNDRYQINLFVHNLLDTRVYLQQSVLHSAFGGPAIGINGFALQPRTIGLSFDVKL